ncbi:MAG: hypothetical protein EHM45_19690, partial [Desulfobacteraceae bacterium]
MKKLFSVALWTALFLTLPALADDFGGPGIGNPGYNQANLTKKDTGAGAVGEDGSYSFSYPMGPVSLNYHSDGGWSWGAGGMITRSTKKGVPKYTLDDTFLLNGQELVATAGLDSGTTIYTLKRQIGPNMLKAYYYTDNTKNQWVVLRSDGSRDEYSYAIRAQGGKFDGQTYAWGLSDQYSRAKYDHTRYFWKDLGQGQHEIEYIVSAKEPLLVNAKDIVKIAYAVTPYEQLSYRTGAKVNTSNYPHKVTHLRQTAASATGSQSISIDGQGYGTYNQVAAWTISADTGFIAYWRVKEIQPEGSLYPDNTAFSVPATVFTYDDKLNLNFEKAYEINTESLDKFNLMQYSDETEADAESSFMDLNGDGLMDRVNLDKDGNLSVWFSRLAGDGSIYFELSNKTVSGMNSYLRCWEDAGGAGNGQLTDLLDINGDGLPDRIRKDVGNGDYNKRIEVRLNKGGGEFESEKIYFGMQEDDYISLREMNPKDDIYLDSGVWVDLLDVNGDGLPDRVIKDKGRLIVKLNTGKGFTAENSWSLPGDNRLLQASWRSGDGNTYTVADLVDMNGDGLPDRITFSDVNIKIYFNYGNGFETNAALWAFPKDVFKYSRVSKTDNEKKFSSTMQELMDFNGDGLPDIVTKNRSTNGNATDISVYFNTGRGFESTAKIFKLATNKYNDTNGIEEDSISQQKYSQTTTAMLDLNGDGLPDRVIKSANKAMIYQLNPIGPSWRKLIKITDKAAGSATDIAYRSLNKADNPKYQPSKVVVKDVTVHDGMQTLQGGLPNHYLLRTNYLYACGVYDVKEREFRGFGCVTEWTQDGSTTKKFYNTDEVLKGLVQKTETYARENDEKDEKDLVSRTDYSYTTHNASTGDWKKSTMILPSKEITQDPDLSGTVRYRTTRHVYSYSTFYKSFDIVSTHYTYHDGETTAEATDMGVDSTASETAYYGWETETSFFLYPTFVKDQGVITKYDYYGNGDLKSVSQVLDSDTSLTTAYTYDSYGNVLTVTDPNKQTVTFSYDDYFHQYKRIEKNALGHTAEYQYDPL